MQLNLANLCECAARTWGIPDFSISKKEKLKSKDNESEKVAYLFNLMILVCYNYQE